jgi:hypothetical protein
MPDGPEIPKSPEWTAWLAIPYEDIVSSAPQAGVPVGQKPRTVPVISFSFFLGGCLVPIVWLAAVVRSLDLMLQAIRSGEAELIPYLIVAHVPLLIGTILNIREFRRGVSETTEGKPEGFSELVVNEKVTIGEQGIQRSPTDFRGWERFESFEFLGTERENWFRIRLRFRDGILLPVEHSRSTFFSRLREVNGFVVPPLLFAVSTLATLAVFVWGLYRFGWRYDVSAAFLASVAHLLVVVPAVFPSRPKKEDEERMRCRLSHMNLLFDAHEATATEVLRRLERYLPRRTPLK